MIKSIPTESLLDTVISGIEEVKGENIKVLSLKELENAFCEYFVICEGNNTTQLNAIAQSVEKFVKDAGGGRPMGTEGKQNAQWVLLDYFSVVVHIFDEETRAFYDLENHWGDAKVIEF